MTTHTPRLLVALAVCLLAGSANAVPVPNLPLPPCETNEDGVETGACPRTSPEVSGSFGGRLSLNNTVDVYTDPQIPPCNTWAKNGDGSWSPSPCYRAVEPVEVVGCAYVDIRSDRFVEAPCDRALFATQTGTQLFTIGSPDSGGKCGGEPDFWVYVYGGPSSQPGARWAERGPTTTHCAVYYAGPEIDGLWGPTWVVMRATIDVQTVPTTTDSGVRKSTEFYVPIDGELRDLGPVAAFEIEENVAGRVKLKNRSVHSRDEAMTFRWDFGDGNTSTARDPEHRYAEAGVYRIKLTARDASGDEDDTTITVRVDFALLAQLRYEPDIPSVDEPVTVTLAVTNPFDREVRDFRLIVGTGLRLDPDLLAQTSGPEPSPPSTLAPGETVTFTFDVLPLAPGRSVIESGAQAYLGDTKVSATETVTILVPPRLKIALSSAVDSTTRVGDTFDVIATLTNEETVELTGIKSEPLSLDRSDIITIETGPTAVDGSDPRVSPITLGPGETTALNWRYEAVQEGAVTMTAFVSGRDPNTDALFFVSAEKRIAIETAAIEVSGARLSPGSPVPGHFGLVRATVANIGSVDVADIDFDVAGNLEVRAVEKRIAELGEEVSPRIALLEVGEARDFLIPIGMTTQADGFGHYDVDVTMTGTATIDGEPSEVAHTTRTTGGLDLNVYWSNLLEDYADATLEFFEGVNDWGESSTIGGSVVGGGEGVLSALTTMGDGLIDTGELVVQTASGKYELTKKGEQLVQTAIEYYHTRSLKEIRRDFQETAGIAASGSVKLGVDGVGTVADWMYQIDKAYAAGDAREVSKLLAEPATTVVLAVGSEVAVERAMAKVWARLIKKGEPRRVIDAKRGPDPLDEPDIDVPDDVHAPRDPADLPYEERHILENEDLTDLPTGVRIADATAARAGLSAKELSWMRDMAKEHGVAFFVRPRPEQAGKWRALGWNAKPMAIKTKSVNQIDVDWLGWDDFADSQGLVVMREPKDPWPKMLEAMESGELQWGSKEVDAIVARYNKRRKEWAEKGALFDKLNAGDGFEIQRNGKTIKTKVTLDADGVMRFTHNNQPVYSDIDLLQVARPDGTPIDPELHAEIMRRAGPGFDVQHGDTMSTSDFPDWETAKKFAQEYGAEHMRGGEPLVIVQGDATTLGYVKSMSIPDAVEGSNYDLFGKITVQYEGAGFP